MILFLAIQKVYPADATSEVAAQEGNESELIQIPLGINILGGFRLSETNKP
jgi:hypothetical protein